jgi:hypothetical protein
LIDKNSQVHDLKINNQRLKLIDYELLLYNINQNLGLQNQNLSQIHLLDLSNNLIKKLPDDISFKLPNL